MADWDDGDDAFAKGEALARNYIEDYAAIGRVGALLFMLKSLVPSRCKKWDIVKADGKYVVREVGLFRSKAVPGFTLGRVVEVEQQLRDEWESLTGQALTDEEIHEVEKQIEMAPLRKRG